MTEPDAAPPPPSCAMNLRFVDAFCWVVALKSVSRAADKLCITQSAMSSRIAALERELGVLLLDRRDKQFRLTAAGLRFHGQARRLLALQREIEAELGGAGTQPRMLALRVGAIESVLHSWLIDWLQQMRVGEPGLALELTVETTPVLLDQMRRGALDLAFAALPASGEGLRCRQLPSMELVFVGRSDAPRKRRWTLAELAGLDLLTFQRGSQPWVGLNELFRDAGLEPRIHAISSISAMVQLVETGFGIATLPRAAVARLTGRPLRVLAAEAALPRLPVHASQRIDPGGAGVATRIIDELIEKISV